MISVIHTGFFQRNIRIKLRSLRKIHPLSSWRMCPSVYHCLLKIEKKKWYASNHTYTLRRQKPSHALKLVLLLYACINLWVRRSFNCWPRRIGVQLFKWWSQCTAYKNFPWVPIVACNAPPEPNMHTCASAHYCMICSPAHHPLMRNFKDRLTTQLCVPPILVFKFSKYGLFVEV